VRKWGEDRGDLKELGDLLAKPPAVEVLALFDA